VSEAISLFKRVCNGRPMEYGRPLNFCPVVSSSTFFFYLSFSSPISAIADWMSAIAYFHTWCGLSANLRCKSETCCTRLAENSGRKKSPKNHHLGTIAQIVWLYLLN